MFFSHDDIAESPTRRAPGYQDFTSPLGGKDGGGRKKRVQPVAPRGRARSRGFSGEEGTWIVHVYMYVINCCLFLLFMAHCLPEHLYTCM